MAPLKFRAGTQCGVLAYEASCLCKSPVARRSLRGAIFVGGCISARCAWMILCTTPSLSPKRRAMSGGRTPISRSLKIFCFSISVSRKIALIMSADIVHIAPELVQWGGIWGVNKASFTTETRRARRTTKANHKGHEVTRRNHTGPVWSSFVPLRFRPLFSALSVSPW